MQTHATPYGTFHVGSKEELFAEAAAIGNRVGAGRTDGFTWALTGGSTPLEWYRWVTANTALDASTLARAHFTVSDERFVPLTDKQSNFGNASELLFNPLGVAAENRHAWPVSLAREEAADAYAAAWAARFGAGKAYDICFLGMGDDAHTASWFPGSPLLSDDGGRLFAGLDVPGKGFRLTITPTGLKACGRVVVMTLGSAKAPALRRVLREAYDPLSQPSQILRSVADRATWLVDTAAAGDVFS